MTATRPAQRARASAERPRVLVVDDDDALRDVVRRFLELSGYSVVAVPSGLTALDVLSQQAFTAMVCDIRMPGLSGLDVVPRALALSPDLTIVMLTASADAETATQALLAGASNYLVKPFDLPALQSALVRAIDQRGLDREQRRIDALIREEVALRTQELEREQRALRGLTVSVAETLVNAMEAKDVYLRGHSQRVADLAASMAEALGLDVDTVEYVRLAGRLHDIGKIGISETVLHKPEKLTDDEFAHIRTHVQVGLDILKPLRHLGLVLDYVRDHHEHWDGGGYPNGIAGEAISIGGRILAAADAFDALTSRRAYREPMAPAAVIAYLEQREVGRLLDPRVFDALREVTLAERTPVLTYLDVVTPSRGA
jgi:putative two-component system response regulator